MICRERGEGRKRRNERWSKSNIKTGRGSTSKRERKREIKKGKEESE